MKYVDAAICIICSCDVLPDPGTKNETSAAHRSYSLADELRTLDDRLTHVSCCYRRFCASGRTQKDFKPGAEPISGGLAGTLTSTHLTEHDPVHHSACGPWLACNKSCVKTELASSTLAAKFNDSYSESKKISSPLHATAQLRIIRPDPP
eukprot:6178198-Pleurochrysis_carterae.AAC.1